MEKYKIVRHNRGNHSAAQVYHHGILVFSGNKGECKKELIRMRSFCRDKYSNVSTVVKLRDYVDYEMSDIFFVKVIKGVVEWA